MHLKHVSAIFMAIKFPLEIGVKNVLKEFSNFRIDFKNSLQNFAPRNFCMTPKYIVKINSY